MDKKPTPSVDLMEGISEKMNKLLEEYKKKMTEEKDELIKLGVELVNQKFKEFNAGKKTIPSPSGKKQPPVAAGSSSTQQKEEEEKYEQFSPGLTSSPKRQQQASSSRGSGRARGAPPRNPPRRGAAPQYRVPRTQLPIPSINELMVTDEWAEEEEQAPQQPRQPRARPPVLTMTPDVIELLPN